MNPNDMQNRNVSLASNQAFSIFLHHIHDTERSIDSLLMELCELLQAEKIEIEYHCTTPSPPKNFSAQLSPPQQENILTELSRVDSNEYHEYLLGNELILKVCTHSAPNSHYSGNNIKLISQLFLMRLIQQNEQSVVSEIKKVDAAISSLSPQSIKKYIHDIRNHLGIVKGYTTTLLRQDIQWPLDKQAAFLTVINSETDTITDLIANFYTAFKLANHQLEVNKQWTDLNELVSLFIRHNQSKHPGIHIHISFLNEPAFFMVDSELIRLLFQNIVDILEKDNDNLTIWFKITIVDSGICFIFENTNPSADKLYANDNWQSVFESFSENGFTDFSLAKISETILLLHNGSMKLEPNADGKSIFTIFLPREIENCQ